MEHSLGLAAEDRAAEVACRQVAELLGDYMDETLPKAQHECVEQHAEGCAACRAFAITYEATVNAVNRFGADPSR